MHSTEKSGHVQQPPHCLLLSQTEFRLSAYIQFHSLLQNTSPPHTQPSVKFSPRTDFKSPACTVMENALMPQPPPNTYWPNQTSWAKCTNPTKTRCNFQGSEKRWIQGQKSSLHLALLVTFLVGGQALILLLLKGEFHKRVTHWLVPQYQLTIAVTPVIDTSFLHANQQFLSGRCEGWVGRTMWGRSGGVLGSFVCLFVCFTVQIHYSSSLPPSYSNSGSS